MSETKIVAFGDSVTAGTSAKLDVFHDCFQYGTTTVNMVRETQTWRSIAARILSDWVEDGVEVINGGVAGDTIVKGAARLERDVLSHSPDYVLVMFGAEDVLQGVETGTFQENLEKIVNGITAHNARPVLMTPTPVSERMTANGCTIYELRHHQARLSYFTQTVRKLAEEKSFDLIDLNRYFLDNRLTYDHLFEGWLPDGVAQSGMASFVAGELLPMLGVKDFPKPILCDYRKIYSDASNPQRKHSAFTYMTFFGGQFYVSFDSGVSHATAGRRGIVLKSVDGITWEKEAILEPPNMGDVGRPGLLQVEGNLFGYSSMVTRTDIGPETRWRRYKTYGFERLGPGQWSQPFECAPCLFWYPRKWRNQYVVAGYGWPEKDAGVRLLSSPDGRTWKVASTICKAASGANETDLWAEGDELTAFSRADPDEGDHYMLVSKFIESEKRWGTVSSGRVIQAPCVFKVRDRLFVAGRTCAYPHEEFTQLAKECGRFAGGGPEAAEVDPARVEKYHHGLRTGIFVMDGTRPRQVAELLSAGDTSYTGVVRYGDEYVISDYSMHEYYRPIRRPEDWRTPCDIYVSRIRFGG